MNAGRPPAVWQICGGMQRRRYAEVFLKYGVALIGKGRPDQRDSGPSADPVRRFAAALREGDLVLLRTANDTVEAIGLVAGGYQCLEAFDDVDGLDLRHARRVRWFRLPEPYRFDSPVFGTNPCSLVQNRAVANYAKTYLASGFTHWQTAPLPALPPVQEALDEAPKALREVVGLACDLAALYADPACFGEAPNESEIVTHLVVPLLRALGWPPERIAVEWHHIDVALFGTLPRTSAHCRFVLEAKRFGSGLEGAKQQAQDYVTRLGVGCDFIVTDGLRYHVCDQQQDFAPVAYANLARLKKPALDFFAKVRCP